MSIPDILKPTDTFVHRHIGPNPDDIQEMLSTLGLPSLDALIDATIPADIRLRRPLTLGPHRGEHEVLARLRALAGRSHGGRRGHAHVPWHRPRKTFLPRGTGLSSANTRGVANPC